MTQEAEKEKFDALTSRILVDDALPDGQRRPTAEGVFVSRAEFEYLADSMLYATWEDLKSTEPWIDIGKFVELCPLTTITIPDETF